jgi:hypothetical protein
MKDEARPARKADNFTTICEPIVSQPYGPPRPLTRMALPFTSQDIFVNKTIAELLKGHKLRKVELSLVFYFR